MLEVKPYSILLKPVSADCDLECLYCFYKKVKEVYSGNETRMAESVLEILLGKYLEMNFTGFLIIRIADFLKYETI